MTLLRRWFALCALVLIVATWRLWTPQIAFPQIPFFAVLCDVPGWVDWIALAGMLVGLVGLLTASSAAVAARHPLTPDPSSQGGGHLRANLHIIFAACFLASLVTLVALNQHRLQVWAYHFAIVAIVLGALAGTACSEKAFSLLRVLTIGIYFWSAVSKLDYTFLHTLGPELLQGMLNAFGLEPRWMRSDVAAAIALAFPLDELAVAGLLAFRQTRRFGLIASIVMHLLLLATLGPWGLDHSWGVLLWNVYFIGQNVLIFGPMASGWRNATEASDRFPAAPPVPLSLGRGVRGEGRDDGSLALCNAPSSIPAEPLPSTHASAGHPLTPGPSLQRRGEKTLPVSNGQTRSRPTAARLASWVVYAAVVLPVLEPFGWLDHWPGWAVYAPAGERVALVTPSSPEAMSEYFVEFPHSKSGVVRFDRWSLDTLPVPLYPDSRFAVGVSLAVIARYESEELSTLKHSPIYVQHRADRFTGDRTSEWMTGIDRIRGYADSFWINTRSRNIGGW